MLQRSRSWHGRREEEEEEGAQHSRSLRNRKRDSRSRNDNSDSNGHNDVGGSSMNDEGKKVIILAGLVFMVLYTA